MNVEKIARICHQTNKAYCEMLGDSSQVDWGQAPDWQKDSAIKGVQVALNGGSAENLHDSWAKQKEVDGWKYGPVKDADKKEHPCMVPYKDLPPEQQKKDALFAAIVTALSPKVDQ